MRRGFYFSFDALVALSILGLTAVFLLGTSSPSQSSVDSSVQEFQQTNSRAEDAAQLASHTTLDQAFSEEQVQDYLDDSSLDSSDTDKSVMNVIAILWASNETDTAADITETFFADVFSGGYGYRLNISGETEDVVFNSSRRNGSEAVANAKRVVSGVQKDRPQEGYLARARATEVDKNTTEVFGIPMSGSAVQSGDSNALELTRQFHIDAQEIQNATLYLSMQTGGSDPNSIDVTVNGDDAGFPNRWDHEVDKDGNKMLFHTEDITSLLEEGWNSVFVSAKNTGASQDVNESVHVNPGARVEVTYSSNVTGNITNTFRERKYFTDIKTTGHNSQDHGVWSVMSYYVPEDATVTNVTLNLHALDVDEVGDENETQVFVNQHLINATSLCESDGPPCDGEKDIHWRYNLTNHTQDGTNVVAVYVDTFLSENGRIDGFGDDDEIEIHAAPQLSEENSSFLEYEYEREETGLVFGKIKLSRTEEFGGDAANPKAFNTTFEPNASLLETFTHLAQLDSENITVDVEDGERQTAFMSPRDFATPTDIFIDPDMYDTGEDINNTINISDDCTVNCSILPETTFERRQLISSQVPYGTTFRNASAAQSDAEERLNETLGEFVDATEITSDTLSVNDVPWLFGPVTFELEVWKE